jgi:tetratricopeptide (TPR) repeat protein
LQIEFAQMALASGDLAGAERASERVLLVSADNLNAQLLLAECAAKRGDSSKALQYLSSARAKHPWIVQPMLAMAALHIQNGAITAAEPELRAAQALAMERAGSLAEIARLWTAAKRYDDAANVLKAATTLQPNNGHLWGRLSEAELVRGEAEAARDAAQKAFAIQADAGSLRLLLQAYSKLDQTAVALKSIREFRASNPQNIEAAVLEGDALMLARDYSSASQLYDELLAQFIATRARGDVKSQPASNSDRNSIATGSLLAVKASQARREGALQAPNEPLLAWLKQHDVPVVRLALADGYRADGDLPTAISNYQQVLVRSPDNITALNNLAIAYFEAKDPRALETARKAYTLQAKLAAVADTYGWILLHEGRAAEALPVLRAAAADGQSAEIEYHYAVALARAGNSKEAMGLLKKILAPAANFPGKENAEQLLKELQTAGPG